MVKKSKKKKKYPPGLEFNKEREKTGASLTQGKFRFNKPIFHLFLIIGIGFLAYSNTFHAPFQWDESDFLVQNPIVKNLEYFLNPSKAKGIDPDHYVFFKTRYFSYLTFALNYKIHGFEVFGYHLFNLAIHIVNALLVYLFAILTFRTPFLREAGLVNKSGLIALFSALLFVSHPIQTEAVTYVFQRHASLVTFFYLLTIVFYIQWRLKSEGGAPFRSKSFLIYSLSFISALLAMKTKENAFTLPLTIMICEFFFFAGPIRTRVFSLIPILLTLTIIPLTLIEINKPIHQVVSQLFDPSLLLIKEVSKEAYLFTQFRVILTYIRLLFFPVHQNLDYDYPIYASFFTLQVLPSFLFHLIMVSIAIYLFHRSRQGAPEWRLPSFGILWFFLALSVESSIIPLQMIICEYRVYLPSVGFFMAVMTSSFILIQKYKGKFLPLEKTVVICFTLVIMLLSVLTYARNLVWMDVVRMWEDVTTKSPGNARGHYNLGLAYAKLGQVEDAAKEFETTLKLNPLHAKAHNNLGNIFDQQGRPDDAIREFQASLKLNPSDPNVHYNLGLVFGGQSRWDDAAREFQMALKLNPSDANAHNSLGVILAQQGRWDDAVREFQAALKLNPDHAKARNNLKKAMSLRQ